MTVYDRLKAANWTFGPAFLSSVALFLATTESAGAAPVAPVFSFNATISSPEGVMRFNGSNDSPIVTGHTLQVAIPGSAEILTFDVAAKPGILGSQSSVSALAPGSATSGVVSADSLFALDNIKIIDPNLPAGTPVSYSINFQMHGGLVAAAFGSSAALASVELFADGLALGEATASTTPGVSRANGIFSAGVANVTAHTPLEPGAVGQPAFAEFELVTNATLTVGPSAHESGQGSATADFLDPFSFPTNGPVFNFFDANGNPLTGVTVDSSDGCIVNNRFLCAGGPTPVGPTPVPEPSAWALMSLGFAGLGYLGRRSRRKQQARE